MSKIYIFYNFSDDRRDNMCSFSVEMFRFLSPSQPQALPISPRGVSAGPQVLLVEDDPRQRALLSRLLAEAGYAVTVAGNSVAALGELSGRFDLLITDVDLDCRLNGLDNAHLAHFVKPDLPVLVLSARAPVDAEGITCLRKPCTSAAILSAVQSLAPIE
jgi:CheY-like chemotaxis protein